MICSKAPSFWQINRKSGELYRVITQESASLKTPNVLAARATSLETQGNFSSNDVFYAGGHRNGGKRLQMSRFKSEPVEDDRNQDDNLGLSEEESLHEGPEDIDNGNDLPLAEDWETECSNSEVSVESYTGSSDHSDFDDTEGADLGQPVLLFSIGPK